MDVYKYGGMCMRKPYLYVGNYVHSQTLAGRARLASSAPIWALPQRTSSVLQWSDTMHYTNIPLP
eukprot:33775-Eustigmatos_ZCMA.PRE.1